MSFPIPIDTDRASLRDKSLLMLISPLRSASTKTTDWSVPTQRLGASLPRTGSHVRRGGWFDAAWSGPPQGGGLRLAVSWAPCPVPSRGSGVLGCVDGQRAQGAASLHVTRHGINACWGPELYVAPPKQHVLLMVETASVRHPAPRGSRPRWDGDGK